MGFNVQYSICVLLEPITVQGKLKLKLKLKCFGFYTNIMGQYSAIFTLWLSVKCTYTSMWNQK